MSKPVTIVLAVIGWAGVILAMNFSKLVPHASEEEIKPFLTGAIVFAIVATILVVKSFMSSPK